MAQTGWLKSKSRKELKISLKNTMKNKSVHSYNYLKENRKNLRNNLTPSEARLWSFLKNKKLDGRKFRRQHSIGKYIVDFYCPKENLIIELDGHIHFNPINENYDSERDDYMKKLGFNVLRFENKLVFKQTEMILNSIRDKFKMSLS